MLLSAYGPWGQWGKPGSGYKVVRTLPEALKKVPATGYIKHFRLPGALKANLTPAAFYLISVPRFPTGLLNMQT